MDIDIDIDIGYRYRISQDMSTYIYVYIYVCIKCVYILYDMAYISYITHPVALVVRRVARLRVRSRSIAQGLTTLPAISEIP